MYYIHNIYHKHYKKDHFVSTPNPHKNTPRFTERKVFFSGKWTWLWYNREWYYIPQWYVMFYKRLVTEVKQ